MKTAYCISSRTCNSHEGNESKFLLDRENLLVDGDIKIDRIESEEEELRKIKEYLDKEHDDLTPDEKTVVELLKTGSFVSLKDLRELKTRYSGLYQKIMHDSSDKIKFKTVYKLKSTPDDWSLFCVEEISTDDPKEIVESVRKNNQWCNLLIQYILDKVDNVEKIHLFLHDKDIDGYSNHTEQMIDGVDTCKQKKQMIDGVDTRKQKNLISQEMKKKLTGKTLTISFFKHVSLSRIYNVIGPSIETIDVRINSLPDRFSEVMDYLRGIYQVKGIANDEWKTIESKRGNDA